MLAAEPQPLLDLLLCVATESQPNVRLLTVASEISNDPCRVKICGLRDLCIMPKGLKSMKEFLFFSVESTFSIGI